MKVALTSDTHLGITGKDQLRIMLKKLAAEEFDILIHAGDYCGGSMGWEAVGKTVALMRDYIPNKPIVSVIGNHDYWCKPSLYGKEKANLSSYYKNYDKICRSFKDHNIHFLDMDGVYRYTNSPIEDVLFFGASGWYQTPFPKTNDINFLPEYMETGNIHQFLLKKAEDIVHNQLSVVKGMKQTKPDIIPVFVSHFPVIDTGPDYKGPFEEFCWSKTLGQIIQEETGCKFFLNGHSHQKHIGPLRYEAGPDYYRPNYIIIEVF